MNLLAGVPFLFSVALIALSPLCERHIRRRLKDEFKPGAYLARAWVTAPTVASPATGVPLPPPTGTARQVAASTPPTAILGFVRWSSDVMLGVSVIFGPVVGLAFASTADVGTGVVVLYFVLLFVGVASLLWVSFLDDPINYGSWQARGLSKLSWMSIALYLVAGVLAVVIA